MSQVIDAATNLEARALRTEHSEIVVAASPSGDRRVLHIPDGSKEQPACQREYDGHTQNKRAETFYCRKSVAVYPRGYKPWCKYCVDLYRDGQL